MSRFPWGVVVGVVFAVAVVLTVFGWLDEAAVGVLGVTTATAVVWLSLLAVRAVLDVRRPIPEVHERLFDLYIGLGAEGHDPHIGDACVTCAEDRYAEVQDRIDEIRRGGFKSPAESARDFTFSAYEAGLISADQIGDLGLTYERAVVVPMPTRRDDHYEYAVYDCPACHTRSGMRIPRSLSGMSSIEYQCGACGTVRTHVVG
jgi:hypothetical protein